MTQLEKLEALLDEMGVWYEREDRDDKIYISIPGKTEGYKNRGANESLIVFDPYGNCKDYFVSVF